MSSKPESAQWKHEATRNAETDRIIGENDSTGAIVPPNERIESQPREAYAPPRFLRETATPAEQEELREILDELWRLNDEFAEERTTELEVFLAVTGEVGELSELARLWCESYFTHRLRKVSPRDRGDPRKMFIRLCKEYDDIFGRLATRAGCIDYVPLQQCTSYVRWLLGNATIEALKKDRSPTASKKLDWFRNDLNDLVPLQDFLSPFTKIVSGFTNQDTLSRPSQYTESNLRQKLRDVASDVQEMRPYLVRGFDFAKTTISTDNKLLWLAWDWATRFGIANILSNPTEEHLVASYATSRRVVVPPIAVGHDGILMDGTKPWITAATIPAMPGVNPLAVNLYVLEMFRDKLYSFYDKIDFARINQRVKEVAITGNITDDEEDELLVQSCQQLAATEPSVEQPAETPPAEEPSRRPLIRPLRMRQLLNFLVRKFACEVKQGKGSEVTVFRPGGKKKILAHHRQNESVCAIKVKQTLSRLGISTPEWMSAVYE